MDILSLIGVVLGFAAIIGGNFLEGGHVNALVNGPAALIVMGGTLGAAVLQTPKSVFLRAMRMLIWVVKPPQDDFEVSLKKILDWASTARRNGLLGLEKIAANESNQYARKGLQLLVDGKEPEQIRLYMELELTSRERRNLEAAKVYDAMGGYAPTIGIIGAVMGLIHVMGNLADPSMLGSGIAVAFVSTIYGVGIANLFFIPIANKLRAYARHESHVREMLIEGLLSIAEGEKPRSIGEKLKGFYEDA
ncbi:MAG: flagellar motor protein [Pseudomonadales bacterium]